MGALKHTHHRVGDHWVEKDEPGDSDPPGGETFGGIDVEGSTRQELYERARRLGVEGRSRMTKNELARALARAQQRGAATAGR